MSLEARELYFTVRIDKNTAKIQHGIVKLYAELSPARY